MRKKTEGKGPRKKNLKVIHTAESRGRTWFPPAQTLTIVWKISPSQEYSERRIREVSFLPTNKRTWEVLKFSSAIEISPKEQDMFYFSVELYARKHKIQQQTKNS